MTLKEAILKTLADLKSPTDSKEVHDHIIQKQYYDFGEGKTPLNTVNAQCGLFITKGDVRVSRKKDPNSKRYLYFLTKNKEALNQTEESDITQQQVQTSEDKTYTERSLHRLLSTYLYETGVHAKTIFHEKSNRNDEHQKWVHPDMVGIELMNLKTTEGQNLLKVSSTYEVFKLYSYEIKKEINTDYELKKYYFQAVSNSSWANYGYLVAFEISKSLYPEVERLNQSFGIGVIEIDANPFQSKELFPAKYREIDFQTVDKLCGLNKDFKEFVEKVVTKLNSPDMYEILALRDLKSYCDKVLSNETDAYEKYCKEHNIPYEKDDDLMEVEG